MKKKSREIYSNLTGKEYFPSEFPEDNPAFLHQMFQISEKLIDTKPDLLRSPDPELKMLAENLIEGVEG